MTGTCIDLVFLQKIGAVIEENHVRLRGVLCAGGKSAFVELGTEGDVRVLQISDKTLFDRLLDAAPPYAGGKYAYWDSVEIEGLINSDSEAIEITKVLSIRLRRDDMEYFVE